jgi:hypothetical protein
MRLQLAVVLREKVSGNQSNQQIMLLLERELKLPDISLSMMESLLEGVRIMFNYSRAFILLSIKITS